MRDDREKSSPFKKHHFNHLFSN